MFSAICRVVLQVVVVLLGMSILVFIVSHVVPSDPARTMAGDYATDARVEQIREEMGLDEPLVKQYFVYVWALLHGDLGDSFVTRRRVLEDMKIFFPATIELSLVSLLVSLGVGIPLGLLAAVKHGGVLDHASRVTSMAGASMPIFWYGLILQLLFYRYLGWLPIGGRLGQGLLPPPHVTGMYVIDSVISGDWPVLLSAMKHLILPAISLSFMTLALITRITRASVLEVLHKDYVNTARSKGLTERRVLIRHVLRNASLPIVTVVGLQVGHLFAGAVLTETVFSWPGIGSYAFKSIQYMDFPALMGFAILVSACVVLLNLLTDLLYPVLDPRVQI